MKSCGRRRIRGDLRPGPRRRAGELERRRAEPDPGLIGGVGRTRRPAGLRTGPAGALGAGAVDRRGPRRVGELGDPHRVEVTVDAAGHGRCGRSPCRGRRRRVRRADAPRRPRPGRAAAHPPTLAARSSTRRNADPDGGSSRLRSARSVSGISPPRQPVVGRCDEEQLFGEQRLDRELRVVDRQVHHGGVQPAPEQRREEDRCAAIRHDGPDVGVGPRTASGAARGAAIGPSYRAFRGERRR